MGAHTPVHGKYLPWRLVRVDFGSFLRHCFSMLFFRAPTATSHSPMAALRASSRKALPGRRQSSASSSPATGAICSWSKVME